MSVKMVSWKPEDKNRTVSAFLQRPAFDDTAETVAAEVLQAVRREGRKAVALFARRFDGVDISRAGLKVSQRELDEAAKQVSAADRSAIRESCRRVAAFSKAGKRKNWSMKTGRGGVMGEQFSPLDRVGVYVPGGKAPLASTAVMTATIARVAGVREIVACTPSDKNGRILPEVLYALKVSGATEIYRVGGIQSIGLMAYGIRGVEPVQKIVGPGGAFVTAAKRQVYGQVALDLVAGPSEIAVLADSTANPAHVAADLLSQAEHGTGDEKALLVTTSSVLAKQVAEELDRQAETLGRRDAVKRVMKQGMLIVTVPSLEAGMDLCNQFAPEHFELLVESPRHWLKRVKCAGAVFLGPWTPESVGDFAAGPSHVLPTGGAARMFSGLTVDDFCRRSSFMQYTRHDLAAALPVITAFGRMEGLDGHARSATMRFE